MPSHERLTAPQALFRFFTVDHDEPIQLVTDARAFDVYVEYDGKHFKSAGPTNMEDYPSGYSARVVCAWDFQQIFPRSMHPHSAPGEHPAKCIVCDAPFPLHTIRCGTPG